MSALQRPGGTSRLADFLVQAGILPEDVVRSVLQEHQRDRRLTLVLVERGLVNGALLAQLLSYHLSVPWVSLEHVHFSEKLLAMSYNFV